MGQSMRLGGGGRFAALAASLSRKGVRNPEAVAASIGRKKYGKKKFQLMSIAAKREGGYPSGQGR